MQLRKDYSRLWLLPIAILLFGFGFTWGFRLMPKGSADAVGEEVGYTENVSEYFVTIFDDSAKTIVKTSAATVGELLGRLGTTYSSHDIIEPALDTTIDSDNFYINIFRARPVVLQDGELSRYTMTASHDLRSIFEGANITVYDGDEIFQVHNPALIETGIMAETYAIRRNGGREITLTEEIPFTTQTVKDYHIPVGSSEVRQFGQPGAKTSVYVVNYINGKEVSRELVSETITRAPVTRIVAEGARASIPPEWSTCAGWAREAGVPESDIYAALTIIYRESGCRAYAKNSRSGAYGIPQALPGSKMATAGADWETNPVTQIRWMSGYVKGRYGGWTGALEFWDKHHWY